MKSNISKLQKDSVIKRVSLQLEEQGAGGPPPPGSRNRVATGSPFGPEQGNVPSYVRELKKDRSEDFTDDYKSVAMEQEEVEALYTSKLSKEKANSVKKNFKTNPTRVVQQGLDRTSSISLATRQYSSNPANVRVVLMGAGLGLGLIYLLSILRKNKNLRKYGKKKV